MIRGLRVPVKLTSRESLRMFNLTQKAFQENSIHSKLPNNNSIAPRTTSISMRPCGRF